MLTVDEDPVLVDWDVEPVLVLSVDDGVAVIWLLSELDLVETVETMLLVLLTFVVRTEEVCLVVVDDVRVPETRLLACPRKLKVAM